MRAKVVLILAAITMAMGSMGCSTISERYIVGGDRRATMDYQKENYTVTEQNGTTTFTLSPKGKVALAQHERKSSKERPSGKPAAI